MVVIKGVLLCLLIFPFLSCTVENTPGTPGTFNCNPTTGDLALFQVQVYNTLLLRNCITCHGNGTQANAQKTRFKLQAVTQTDADKRNNLCTSYLFGQLSPSRSLVTHPLDAKHSGGRFSEAEIQSIIDWIGTYRLPLQ